MKQYLVLTLAVVFFTACGQKKEAAQQTPVAQQASGPAPTMTPEQAQAEAAKVAADKAATDKAAADKAAADKAAAAKKDKSNRGSARKKPAASPAKPATTPAAAPTAAVSTNEFQLTGGKSKSGLIYTGSSADFIITQLVAAEKMKSTAEQNRNMVLAASVWEMAYLIDSAGQLHIDIEFIKANGLSRVQVAMPFQDRGIMEVIANPGTSSAVLVTAQCMDSESRADQCSNLLVQFARDGAKSNAVLRQTRANIWFEYERTEKRNEYTTLVDFFKNAKLDVEIDNKIDSAFLNTFEVVNGKSGFKALITGKKNQVIGFEADLLLKADLSPSNIDVLKQTHFRDIDMWMGRIPDKDVSFMQNISAPRLTGNNSKGEITVDMTVTSPSTGTKNQFTLKFIRIPVSASLQ